MRWRRWIGAAPLTALLALALLAVPLGAQDSSRSRISAVAGAKVNLKLDHSVIRGDRVRLELARGEGSLRGCQAYTAGPGGWERARVDWSSARPEAKAVLELEPDQMVLFKPNVAEVQELSAEGVSIPGGLFLNDRTGGQGSLRTFRLHLRPVVSPLPWVESGSAFETDLFVGIREEDPKPGAAPISWEHPVTVVLTGTTARADPNTVGITRSGTRGFRKVRLRCRTSDPEPTIEGDSPVGIVALRVPVEVLLHRIDLTATKTRIWGYGLEATTLGVELFSQDGLPWEPAEPLAVALTTNRGNVPSTIEVPAGSSRAEGEIRSGDRGTAEIKARARGVESEPLLLEFTVPVSVLVWALVGAFLGSVARILIDARNRKPTDPVPSLGRQVARVFIGLVAGPLLAAGVLLGLYEGGLPPLAGATEVGAAVVSLVGGYVGARVIDWFSKKIFPPAAGDE
jgi:hypothetical protein